MVTYRSPCVYVQEFELTARRIYDWAFFSLNLFPTFVFLPAAAAVDVADVPLLLPFKTLVSTLSSSSFGDSETQKLLEIISDKAGADTWQLVQPPLLFHTLSLYLVAFFFFFFPSHSPFSGRET